MQQGTAYTRVSTEEQAREGVSLEAQADRVKAYAIAQDINLVHIIREEGISGAIPLADRPGGAELLQVVGKGKPVTHVIALKLDRLFRDASDCLVQTKVWDKAGIGLHLLDMGGQSINTASAMGRMFLTVAAGFAELERNLIAERTAAAMQYKKKRLEAYSPYTRTGDTLTPVGAELKRVRWMRRQRKAGTSLRGIAARLNQREVETKKGGRWYASTVKYLLENPLYQAA